MPFVAIEDPMPQVNLAGGFSVSLRTMFKGQPCQYRYGRIENETYPISSTKRQQLQDALTWLSSKEMQGKTWINTDKNEILFIYPSKLRQVNKKIIRMFKRSEDSEHQKTRFEAEAEKFREYISDTKLVNPEQYPDNIQIFILRKLDKARTKVIYTRCASPDEIICRSLTWQKASNNLPLLTIGTPRTLFPLEISKIMNQIWIHNDVAKIDAYKIASTYHGIDLLFGVPLDDVVADLHRLSPRFSKLALCAGLRLRDYKKNKMADNQMFWNLRDNVILISMLLYWMGVEKGDYVNSYPYFLGQILRAADNLHALYCQVVRNGDIPPQLVGCSMYVFASESPLKAFNQLVVRMKPYIAWAKTYRIKEEREGEIEKKHEVGYYLHVFEKSSERLLPILTEHLQFTDYEKAILFIGYLSSFPKKEHGDSYLADFDKKSDGGKDDE